MTTATTRNLPRSLDLPTFPWDTLAAAKQRAYEHPDGIVDLSVGSPVDDVADVARHGLESAWNSHFYPTVAGTQEVREAIVSWCATQRNATTIDTDSCFPTIGSKELVANLGWQLGVSAGANVLFPDIAYPTYDICARIASANPVPVPVDDLSVWPDHAEMVWLNSPSNPTGHVMDKQQLKDVVAWARERGAIVVSDECYAPLAWEEPWVSDGVPSLLNDDVTEGDISNLLMVYSTSKQSNLAGYRAAFIAGDPDLIQAVIGVRKHCGFMTPAPTQAALKAVLENTEHVERQKEVYAARRKILKPAVEHYGLEVDKDCVAGLYLWAKVATTASSDTQTLPTGDHDMGYHQGRAIVDALAREGILVAPGEFYGHRSSEYVRIALTASDEKIAQAAQRLEKGRISF